MIIHRSIEYNSGDLIIFKIQNFEIHGKLHIDRNDFYVCHDDERFCGNVSPNRHGYTYSWVFRKQGDSFTDDVEIIGKLGSSKSTFKIDDELSDFFKVIKLPILNIIKQEDVLKDYDVFEKSNIKGLITMGNSTTNKKVDIKFGRFIRTISNEYKYLKIEDKVVEDIFNKYVLFQQGDFIKVKTDIKGEDILKYYLRENQDARGGTRLSGSCMNNRPSEFLDIYVKNPNSVSLIAVEQLGIVVGRALLWTLSDGRFFMDRRYTSQDWVDGVFTKLAQESNYIYDKYNDELSVDLENVDFEQHPYIDTFRYLSYSDKKLFNYRKRGEVRLVLDRTDGTSWTSN